MSQQIQYLFVVHLFALGLADQQPTHSVSVLYHPRKNIGLRLGLKSKTTDSKLDLKLQNFCEKGPAESNLKGLGLESTKAGLNPSLKPTNVKNRKLTQKLIRVHLRLIQFPLVGLCKFQTSEIDFQVLTFFEMAACNGILVVLGYLLKIFSMSYLIYASFESRQ